jgi:hypothetical protein
MIAVLFTWFSFIIAVNTVFSILNFLNIKLSEKLTVYLMFAVISGGGVLTNILIISTPIDSWIKGFALTILMVLHVPLLIAVMAYLKERRA